MEVGRFHDGFVRLVDELAFMGPTGIKPQSGPRTQRTADAGPGLAEVLRSARETKLAVLVTVPGQGNQRIGAEELLADYPRGLAAYGLEPGPFAVRLRRAVVDGARELDVRTDRTTPPIDRLSAETTARSPDADLRSDRGAQIERGEMSSRAVARHAGAEAQAAGRIAQLVDDGAGSELAATLLDQRLAPRALLDSLTRRGVSVDRMFKSIRDPAQGRAVALRLAPAMTADEATSALGGMLEGRVMPWARPTASDFLKACADPAAVTRQLDAYRLWERLDDDGPRAAFLEAALPHMSREQKADFVAHCAKGHTSGDEERAMRAVMTSSPSQTEAQQLLALLQREHGIDYERISDELEETADRSAFERAVLSPQQVARFEAHAIPIGETARDAQARASAAVLEPPASTDTESLVLDGVTRLQAGSDRATTSRALLGLIDETGGAVTADVTALESHVTALVQEKGRIRDQLAAIGGELQGSPSPAVRTELEAARVLAEKQWEALQPRLAEARARLTEAVELRDAWVELVEPAGAAVRRSNELTQSGRSTTEMADAAVATEAHVAALDTLLERVHRAETEGSAKARALASTLAPVLSAERTHVAELQTSFDAALLESARNTRRQAAGSELSRSREHLDVDASQLDDADALTLAEQMTESARAVDARVRTLREEARGATARVADLERAASQRPLTAEERVALSQARAVLSPAEGQTVEQQLSALGTLETELYAGREAILNRRDALVETLNQRLTFFELPPVRESTDAALAEGAQRLAAAAGLPPVEVDGVDTYPEAAALIEATGNDALETAGLTGQVLIGLLGDDAPAIDPSAGAESLHLAADAVAARLGEGVESAAVLRDLAALVHGRVPDPPASPLMSSRMRSRTFALAFRARRDPMMLARARRSVGLTVEARPNAELRRISERVRSDARVVGGLYAKGLSVDVETLGLAPSATLSRPMTAEDLARATFGVEAPGAMHLELLSAGNPHLGSIAADTELPAGTRVNLGASPALLSAQQHELETSLGLMERALGDATDPPLSVDERTAITEMRDAVAAQLASARAASTVQGVLATVATADAEATRAATAGAPATATATATASLAEARESIDVALARARDDEVLTASLTRVRTRLNLVESAHLERIARQQIDGGDPVAGRQSLDRAIELLSAVSHGAPAQQRSAITQRRASLYQLAASSLLADPALARAREERAAAAESGEPTPRADAAVARQLAQVDRLMARCKTELESLREADPDAFARLAPRADFFRASLRARVHEATGNIELSQAELAGYFRELMPPEPTGTGWLTPDSDVHYVGTDGDEMGWLASWVRSDTQVRDLTDAKLTRMMRGIQSLPETEQQIAGETLVQLAGSYAGSAAPDPSDVRALQQALRRLGQARGDDALGVQATMVEALYQSRVGNLQGAEASYEAAATAAAEVDDPTERAQLQTQAIFMRASMLGAIAQVAEDRGEREAAARELSGLRRQLERAGEPLDHSQLGQLGVVEVRAYVTAGLSDDAVRTLERLRDSYGDVEEARTLADTFDEQYRTSGAQAALMAALDELNSESMGVALAAGLGGGAAGAAAGAAIGVWFGGVGAIPAAGIGFLIGGAIGTGTVKAVNLVRGAHRIGQAWDTGITDETLGSSLFNSAMLAVDVVSIVAPIKGAGAIGKQGIGAIARGSRSAVTRRLMTSIERDLMETAGRKLTAQELERAAKHVIMREFSEAAINFGGKTGAAIGLSAAAGPLAVEFVRIQNMAEGPEKDAASERFTEQLGTAALTLTATFVAGNVANRAALSPAGATKELRAVIARTRLADVQTPTLRSSGDVEVSRVDVDGLEPNRGSDGGSTFEPAVQQRLVSVLLEKGTSPETRVELEAAVARLDADLVAGLVERSGPDSAAKLILGLPEEALVAIRQANLMDGAIRPLAVSPEALRELEQIARTSPNRLDQVLWNYGDAAWNLHINAGESVRKIGIQGTIELAQALGDQRVGPRAHQYLHPDRTLVDVFADGGTQAVRQALDDATARIHGFAGDGTPLWKGATRPPMEVSRSPRVVETEAVLLRELGLDEGADLSKLSAEDASRLIRSMRESLEALDPGLARQLETEVAGRIFARKGYPEAYEAGVVNAEHVYSKATFDSWMDARRYLKEQAEATRGRPLAEGELTRFMQEAHRRASQGIVDIHESHLKDGDQGRLRSADEDHVQLGDMHQLTTDQLTVMKNNEYLELHAFERPTGDGAAAHIGFAKGSKVPELVAEVDAWVRTNPDNLSPAALAAEVHVRLISIHPFMDGNGRTSKLMAEFICARNGLEPPIWKDGKPLLHRAQWDQALTDGIRFNLETTRRYLAYALDGGAAGG